MRPDFSLENELTYARVAGVDEAGCGPWAGPVVAGAALFLTRDLPQELILSLNDSKKMSAKRRDYAYGLLKAAEQRGLVQLAVAQSSVDEIDTLNIRKAALLAMARALESLASSPEFVLVDGTGKPQISWPLRTVIKGDGKSLSIAAASIVAKVERDRYMQALDVQFPCYGWSRNAGYGTKLHQEAILTNGITPHHRRSFAPIKKYIAR